MSEDETGLTGSAAAPEVGFSDMNRVAIERARVAAQFDEGVPSSLRGLVLGKIIEALQQELGNIGRSGSADIVDQSRPMLNRYRSFFEGHYKRVDWQEFEAVLLANDASVLRNIVDLGSDVSGLFSIRGVVSGTDTTKCEAGEEMIALVVPNAKECDADKQTLGMNYGDADRATTDSGRRMFSVDEANRSRREFFIPAGERTWLATPEELLDKGVANYGYMSNGRGGSLFYVDQMPANAELANTYVHPLVEVRWVIGDAEVKRLQLFRQRRGY